MKSLKQKSFIFHLLPLLSGLALATNTQAKAQHPLDLQFTYETLLNLHFAAKDLHPMPYELAAKEIARTYHPTSPVGPDGIRQVKRVVDVNRFYKETFNPEIKPGYYAIYDLKDVKKIGTWKRVGSQWNVTIDDNPTVHQSLPQASPISYEESPVGSWIYLYPTVVAVKEIEVQEGDRRRKFLGPGIGGYYVRDQEDGTKYGEIRTKNCFEPMKKDGSSNKKFCKRIMVDLDTEGFRSPVFANIFETREHPDEDPFESGRLWVEQIRVNQTEVVLPNAFVIAIEGRKREHRFVVQYYQEDLHNHQPEWRFTRQSNGSWENIVTSKRSNMISHRGKSVRLDLAISLPWEEIGTFPGNTYEALVDSLNTGFDGVEFDVRVTKDGTAVLSHDDLFGYYADCPHIANWKEARKSARISQFDWSDLQKCRVTGSSIVPEAEEVAPAQVDSRFWSMQEVLLKFYEPYQIKEGHRAKQWHFKKTRNIKAVIVDIKPPAEGQSHVIVQHAIQEALRPIVRAGSPCWGPKPRFGKKTEPTEIVDGYCPINDFTFVYRDWEKLLKGIKKFNFQKGHYALEDSIGVAPSYFFFDHIFFPGRNEGWPKKEHDTISFSFGLRNALSSVNLINHVSNGLNLISESLNFNDVVAKVKRNQYQLLAWTVNHSDDLDQLLERDTGSGVVDMIVSDVQPRNLKWRELEIYRDFYTTPY